MLSILSLAGFTTLFSRPDQNHLGFLSAPMWALVACLWERSRGSLRPPLSHLLHVRAVSTVCGIALLLIAVPFSELVVVARGETRAVPTPRGELPIGVHADENFVRIAPEVLAIIVGSTSPSDPIFVYPAFPLYYFLSGRHNATSYDFLYHTAGELQHVISQLERSPPSLVVLDRKNPRLADPNVGDAGSRGGRALLLGKIEANYRMRLERSGIEVWVRRPG